jgi:transcriptional regulator with XRE-family HTH domain
MKKSETKKALEAKKAEKKKRILKNAGQAIEHFRDLKKMSVPVLAKKSGIKIADVNDICTGNKVPNKKQVTAICKALYVPKEVILFYSIDEKDVTPRKRILFKLLTPPLKDMIDSLSKEETKGTKKLLNKAKSLEKTVAKVVKPKKSKTTKTKKVQKK